MRARSFSELAAAQWAAGRMLCVGLDTVFDRAVQATKARAGDPGVQGAFNRAIVDATCDIVGAYKANSAFYEAVGAEGVADLRSTIAYIRQVAPGVPVILDAKRGDIGNTNDAHCEYAFEYLGADAVTVHPYLGRSSLDPFLRRADKGIFVLCRTSNPGGAEFQNLVVGSGKQRLFEYVARSVVSHWNGNRNCGLVVGATFTDELRLVREIAPEVPILVPGVGVQGGDLRLSARFGRDRLGGGLFLNVARAVVFASSGEDFASAARRVALALNDEIHIGKDTE